MAWQDLQLAECRWIDIVSPTEADFKNVAKEFNLPEKLVLNCLDPDYLPYAEVTPEYKFIVLRLQDTGCSKLSNTIHELTTKVALFVVGQNIISLHRQNMTEIADIAYQVQNTKDRVMNCPYVLRCFFEKTIKSFEKPITDLEQIADQFEEKVFKERKTKDHLREGFVIKRRSSAYKKVIKFTIEAFKKAHASTVISNASFILERLDRLSFYSEEIYENVNTLLNLHISIESQKINEASYRTNEIMRVLTVLTIFFLPLNFIAGVYGMNFDVIPLAKHPEGFWISLVLMACVSLGLLTYVLKKGWFTKPPVYKDDV